MSARHENPLAQRGWKGPRDPKPLRDHEVDQGFRWALEGPFPDGQTLCAYAVKLSICATCIHTYWIGLGR
jgi:hypothetical protein